jgi:hypothetical protein
VQATITPVAACRLGEALLPFLIGPILVAALVGILCADTMGALAAGVIAYLALGAGEIAAALWAEHAWQPPPTPKSR